MIKMNYMKKIAIFLTATLFLTFLHGCYDREIIDRKEFYYELPKIENLRYTVENGEVNLSWDIPNSVSDDFNRPLEVVIQLVENDIYGERRTIPEETSTRFAIGPGKQYRFIVKLLGYLTPEARLEGFTDRVFSDAAIIEID